ncbi:metallophosphoesterase [Yunchengibacter salinarum]|uniref:metallophosphoesterase n=1 Tax=Yunchengibacter salinarum TaxID=3133399 RepID=UPI0035B611E6
MVDAAADLHITLPPNNRGRDFYVGDVHGMGAMLRAALDDAGFDEHVDRLISVGDLIDRGPESDAMLALVDADWCFAVRGNHEQMMLDAAGSAEAALLWRENGGTWADGLTPDGFATALERARRLPLALSVQQPDGGVIGVCHAEWPRRDWAGVDRALNHERDRIAMLWGRRVVFADRSPPADITARLTVHGHTPIDQPVRRGSAAFLDTGAVHGGTLTLLTADQCAALPDQRAHPLMRR